LSPDVEFRDPPSGSHFDWIHRRDGETDIYFVCNQNASAAEVDVVFRMSGKQPELWDAVTGSIRDLRDFHEENGRTVVPLRLAPRQSWFVVFREKMGTTKDADSAKGRGNFPESEVVQAVTGPWTVQFDSSWFYPDDGSGGKVRFDQLEDWSERPEDAIRHFSGVATYRTAFVCPVADSESVLYLDLGAVHEIARVRLNGHDLGVVWTAPWRVDATHAIKTGTNELEVEVANLWPNRLIGDATLPEAQRRTVTNVRTYDTMASGTYGCAKCEQRKTTGKPAELLPSGLLGPVTLQAAGMP
jgi:hypothetical protein